MAEPVAKFKKMDPSHALGEWKGEVAQEDANIEAYTPVEIGASRKDKQPVFNWEIINTPKVTTIHINVQKRLAETRDDLLEIMGECLNASLRRYLDHIGVDGEWKQSMNSFCIRFNRSLDSVELAKMTLADFERGLWLQLP